MQCYKFCLMKMKSNITREHFMKKCSLLFAPMNVTKGGREGREALCLNYDGGNYFSPRRLLLNPGASSKIHILVYIKYFKIIDMLDKCRARPALPAPGVFMAVLGLYLGERRYRKICF